MPRLPNLKTKKLVKKLENLGFTATRQKGSHRFFFNYQTKKATVVPIHSGDVKKGLLRKILRDADISVDELLNA